jgi:hypothetical protein
MALYIPASRRRRNALLLALAALVVGLALGYLVGKAGEPSFAGDVRSAQHTADDLATQLERLPIEYEQGLSGKGDSIEEGTLVPLDDAQKGAANLFDGAPWITAKARATTLDAIAEAKVAAEAKVSAAAFEQKANAAAAALRQTFGVSDAEATGS